MPFKNKKNLLDLIRAICTRVKERDGYLNKTKLIKYLYLIDIEYYRVHKETFTGFHWIFKEFGPWAYEYIELFDSIKTSPEFKVKEGDRPDLDTVFIEVTNENKADLDTIIKDFDFERKARQIIDRWADENLAPMLNYVYFNTEPMVDAERYSLLDFTKIHNLEFVPKFRLSKSSITSTQIQKVREKIRVKSEEQRRTLEHDISYTPPKYDDVYFEGIKLLDEEEL